MRKITVCATALSALIIGLANPNVSEAKPNGKAVVSVPALKPLSEFSAPRVYEAAVDAAQEVEARLAAALKKTYKFRERSNSVKQLQRLLGNIKVDGYYGTQTREAHLSALKSRGMKVKHVPKALTVRKAGPRFPSDQSMRCPKWEAKFKEHKLPVEVFSYIAWRESKCNPKAVNARWNSRGQLTYTLNNNGTWDSGLVQINSSWVRTVRDVCNVDKGSMRKDLEALLDVDCNLKMAKWIMENSSGRLKNWSIYGG